MNDYGPLKTRRKFNQALGLHRQGNRAEARKIYRSILKSHPNHPDALHFLGVLSHQTGDAETAIKLIQRAIEVQPDNAGAMKNLGNVHLEQERYEEAEKWYRRVIELEPENQPAWSNLCIALRHLERFEASAAAGRKATELDPEHPVAWYNLGNAYRWDRKYRKAIRCYEKTTQLHPQFSPAHDALCQCIFHLEKSARLSRRTWKKSIRAYERWLQTDPANPVARFMLQAIRGEEVLTRMPDTVARDMFDSQANHFERRLTGLKYRVPEFVGAILKDLLGTPRGTLDALDGGCGTGWCGPHIRPYAARLTGVDISPGMMKKAAARAIYDELVESELTAWLERHPASMDLIVLGDALCYFGDLKRVLTAAFGALRRNGWFIFSVERIPWRNDEKGYRLHPHGRYSHSKRYVDSLLKAAGFSNITYREETLRLEAGKEVAGLMVSAHKPHQS